MLTCGTNNTCSENISSVACIKTLYKGTNNFIDLYLKDKNSNLLDLDIIDEMTIKLFDVSNNVVQLYSYQSNNDEDILNISFKQTKNNELFVNKGKISIDILKEILSNCISGFLYTEIYYKIGELETVNNIKVALLKNTKI